SVTVDALIPSRTDVGNLGGGQRLALVLLWLHGGCVELRADSGEPALSPRNFLVARVGAEQDDFAHRLCLALHGIGELAQEVCRIPKIAIKVEFRVGPERFSNSTRL